MRKNNKLKIFSMILFLISIALIGSFSYAIWHKTFTGNENTINTTGIKLSFLESNDEIININNAIPMTNEEGIAQNDKFDFAVSSETSKTMDITYSLILEKLEASSGKTLLKDDEVKVYLIDRKTGDVVLEPTLVSEINGDYVLATKTHSHTNTIEKIEDQYTLKVWIDQDAENNYDWSEETNLDYRFKIGVKTNYTNPEDASGETYTIKYNSNGGQGTMEDQQANYSGNGTLNKNQYTKEGYVFAGWAKQSKSDDIEFTDEDTITEPLTTTVNGTANLYAVWGHTVTVNTINATSDKSSAVVTETGEGTFNIMPTDNNLTGTVTCTNGAKGMLNNNVLTVTKVKSDTTCTVVYDTYQTVLYADGTLVINEPSTDRTQNISNHSEVVKTYDAWSESNSYFMESEEDQPWYNEEDEISSVIIGSKIDPMSTAWWFAALPLASYGDFTKLDTSNVTDMMGMFAMLCTAGSGPVLKSNDLTKYDASYLGDLDLKPKNKKLVAGPARTTCDSLTLIGLDNWDVSNVTNMFGMFYGTGRYATTWSIGDLSNWNVSNVTGMSMMFEYAGYSATTFELDLSNWDVSKVTDMVAMFEEAGESATTFNLTGLDNWNVSNVTDMVAMFEEAGENAATWSIGDLSNWNVSNVKDMRSMFANSGASAATWSIGDLSNWNVSNVTSMYDMFSRAGHNANNAELYITNWNPTSVTDMHKMFDMAGFETIYCNYDWNSLSNITDSDDMFSYAHSLVGGNGTTYDYSNPDDKTYARPDGSNPGYFTRLDTAPKTISVVVRNGLTDAPSKKVGFNKTGKFNLTPNNVGDYGVVTCTNNQIATIENNVLTVKKVRENTTCTVDYVSIITALHNDGTLIINEETQDIETNIAEHGKIYKTYQPFSNTNSYVMESEEDQPWYYEEDEIASVIIGSEIAPTSTAYWFAGLSYASYGDFTKLDTSNVTDMSSMFQYLSYIDEAGGIRSSDLTKYDANYLDDLTSKGKKKKLINLPIPSSLTLIGLDGWDTKNVEDMSYMFYNIGSIFYYGTIKFDTWSIGDLSNWNVSNVTNMESMFADAGLSARIFELDLSNWNVSNVTNMSWMFYGVGDSASTWSIGEISNWNVSNVTDMSGMFRAAGASAVLFELDLSNWDVSKVTDMSDMFKYAGHDANNAELYITNWNPTSATNMNYMFYNSGFTTVYCDYDWNSLSNITDSFSMFDDAYNLVGGNGTTYDYSNPDDKTYARPDGSNPGYFTRLDTTPRTINVVVQNGLSDAPSKTVDFNNNITFNLTPNNVGDYGLVTCTNNQVATIENNILTIKKVKKNATCTVDYASVITVLHNDGTLIINEETQDIETNIAEHGKIYKTYQPFSNTNSYVMNGSEDQPWYYEEDEIASVIIGSEIAPTSTAYWFAGLSYASYGDFTKLDTSNVTNMSSMFYEFCYFEEYGDIKSSDLTKYDTSYLDDLTSKGKKKKLINLPIPSSLTLIGLDGWDTRNVEDMSYMFCNIGSIFYYQMIEFDTWSIGDLSNWDVSSVTDMRNMFSWTGESATTWSIGDLSNWNVSNVTDMSYMFAYAGESATTWSIGDLSNWNVSNVTDMSYMFAYAGHNATTFNLDLSNWNVSNVTNMSDMFFVAGYSDTNAELYITNWNPTSVTDVSRMFHIFGFKTIYCNYDWNSLSNITDSTWMFDDASNLVGGNGTAYNSSNPKDKTYARPDGSNPGYFTSIVQYTINVNVINGTSNKNSALVNQNSNRKFGLKPNNQESSGSVICTNEQQASINNNVLTVLHVTSDTTCTVIYGDYLVNYHGNGGEKFNYTNVTEDMLYLSYGFEYSDNIYSSSDEYDVGIMEFPVKGPTRIKFTTDSNHLMYAILTNDEELLEMQEIFESGNKEINIEESGEYYFAIEVLGAYSISNLKILTSSSNMSSDAFTLRDTANLKTNEYSRDHYHFIGWSTNRNDTEAQYQDEESISSLNANVGDVIDLYAIWEKDTYTANVIVENGTIDVSNKQGEYQSGLTFNLTPNTNGDMGLVSCTNKQRGLVENNILTINNISRDTTCTVKFADRGTTLFEDGTLIINEIPANRSSDINKHGQPKKDYDGMSNSNSYVFEDEFETPWIYDELDIFAVEIGSNISPTSTANWFYNLTNMKSGDFTKLNTSNVTNMNRMFFGAGEDSSTFNLDLSNWNVSSVTDMRYMFYDAGDSATTWSVGDLSNWNVSNVTDMSRMFGYAGYSATTWSVGDLSNWNVSNVTDMSGMFSYAGYSATTWSVGDLSDWNVSSVTDMSYMFSNAGYSATTWSVGDLSNWNVSNVTDMSRMFEYAGYSATTWSVGDLSDWNVSNVTNMEGMFAYAGESATTFNLDLSNWNVSNVTNMHSMFNHTGYSDTNAELYITNWNPTSVTDMSYMFYASGIKTIYCNYDWNSLSNITDSDAMFSYAYNLVGGNNTAYNSSNPNDKTYARPDFTGQSGYFTRTIQK